MTSAPASASASAMKRPRRRAAPVTRATLPVISMAWNHSGGIWKEQLNSPANGNQISETETETETGRQSSAPVSVSVSLSVSVCASRAEEASEMRVDLTGGVAVVTGGSRGIGRAIAETLAAGGAAVAIAARTEDLVEHVAAELSRVLTVPVIGVPCDVRWQEQCAALVRRVVAELGQIDILINN